MACKQRALESMMLIPDVHHPFPDVNAWALTLRAAKRFKPKHLVVLGDFVDCLQVSKHRKDPDLDVRFVEEMAAGNKALDQLDALDVPGRKIYCSGNHEARVAHYVIDNAPALHGMISVPELLGLERRGWEHVEYGDVATIGKLHITHDAGSAGAGAHEISRQKIGGSSVIGHTHRAAVTYSGTLAGHRYVAAMFGWLGDKEAAKYLKQPLREHWQLAFGVGWLEPASGIVHLQCVPILTDKNGRNYRCVLNGEMVR